MREGGGRERGERLKRENDTSFLYSYKSDTVYSMCVLVHVDSNEWQLWLELRVIYMHIVLGISIAQYVI